MSESPSTLVIGGTGMTGSRVVTRLRAHAATVRIATRSAAGGGRELVRFDWSEPETYAPAVMDVDRIYLIAPPGIVDPVPQVAKLLEIAVRAGTRRVVVLSSSALPDSDSGPGALAPLIRTTVPEWAVLRPSWFMQNFAGQLASGIRERAEIVTATGDGRIGFVDAADIAAVAARALLDPTPHNADHVITGPAALSYAEAAGMISAATGRVLRHRQVSTTEMAARFAEMGLPPDYAAFLAGLDDKIRQGAEDRVTTTVAAVTGSPARSFAEFVDTHRMAFVP
ncbi:NAD(P)H-binding protein [Nocardia flavorosea]|uniref:NAD(P)H-binding protein n=1 Tax=Nocardia flavorosea TaxID=53429 RepID=UPI002457B5DB|nr:NAD(P)H-binding protein [Nocardia flavorosea]